MVQNLFNRASLSVTVESETDVLVNKSTTIAESGYQEIETGITDPGVYTVRISTGNRKASAQYTIQDYHLDTAAGFVVWIESAEIRIVIQE